MQLKILLKWSLLIVSITGIVFFLIIISIIFFNLFGHSNVKSVSNDDSQTPQKLNGEKPITLSAQASLGLPIRLKIPKINVDAPIDSVGITSDGAVGVPKGPTNTAWFNLGPRPGENGSAVITGHYGTWENGGGSVFDNLNTLNPGDKIYVEDEKGVTSNFVVRELRTYGLHEYAPGVFNSGDGKAHLNLITCAGVWSKTLKTYPDRLVVFTDKE